MRGDLVAEQVSAHLQDLVALGDQVLPHCRQGGQLHPGEPLGQVHEPGVVVGVGVAEHEPVDPLAQSLDDIADLGGVGQRHLSVDHDQPVAEL